ncbi:MAG: hypothetical protein R2873_15520 [Caldilineaceae bacterium]
MEALPLPSREKIHLAIEKLLEGLESSSAGHYHLLIAVLAASDVIPDEAKRIIQENNQLPYAVMARIIQQGQLDGTVRRGKIPSNLR